MFFDRLNKSVARAWIRSKSLLRFDQSSEAKRLNLTTSIGQSKKGRIEVAEREAREAADTALIERRKKYCFLNRYKGKWGLPWDLDLTTVESDE